MMLEVNFRSHTEYIRSPLHNWLVNAVCGSSSCLLEEPLEDVILCVGKMPNSLC